MPVSIDYEECSGELVRKWITRVRAHHEVGREVCSPRSRVIEIILGVKRVVSDETAEDTSLHGEPFADRRKIRDVCWSEVTQEFESGDVGRSSGESEKLVILAGLRRQLNTRA